jgi:large subunit ribosomal protein L13
MPDEAPVTPPAEETAAPAKPSPSKSSAPKSPRSKSAPKPKAAPATEAKPTSPPMAQSTPAKPTPRAPAAAPKPAPVAAAPRGTLVDASGLVLGRAASLIAKRLLQGESIVVVNAERSVVIGDRAMVLETYRANRARGSKRTGPHFPRYPDRIFRRTVRGMLPHLKTRGKEALDRLEVYIGTPTDLQGHASQSLEGAKARPALRRPITLGEISHLLGARL